MTRSSEDVLLRNRVILAEGTRDQLLSLTTDLVSLRLVPAHTLYIVPGDQATIEARLNKFGFEAAYLDYASLTTASASLFRGKSIVVSSPNLALDRDQMVGRIDGALVKVLTSRSRGKVIVTLETTGKLHVRQPSDIGELSRKIAQRMTSKPAPDTWLNELLLELLYKGHSYLAELERLVTASVWWYAGSRDAHVIRDALQSLSRMGLICEERGSYVSTRLGKLVVSGGLPIARSNLAELREQSEAQRREVVSGGDDDDLEPQRLGYFQDLIFELVNANGWVTVGGVALQASRANVTKRPSRWIARKFLDQLVSRGKLSRYVYNRGNGAPMFVYTSRSSADVSAVFENRCGDCVFYAKVARRCRLWWALSRFSGPEVYSKRDKLSAVAKDKLANANIPVGPNATACDFFTPKKRDFPITRAREVCLGCGKGIEPMVAKLVRCGNCGTAYRPLSTKILVYYNYESIFRDRYFEIAGIYPPDRAKLIPGEEYYGRSDSRDLVVLYPDETVRLGADGIYVRRVGGGTILQYERIYQVLDYGALGSSAIAGLRQRGVPVVQRSLTPGGNDSSVSLHPSEKFVENLRILKRGSRLRRRFLESLMLSTIVATKRVADQGGQPLQVLVNRQLLEYKRMIRTNECPLAKRWPTKGG